MIVGCGLHIVMYDARHDRDKLQQADTGFSAFAVYVIAGGDIAAAYF